MDKRTKPIHHLTAAEFERMSQHEEVCRGYLVARRWPDGVRCPRCGNSAVYRLSREWHWQCEKCAPDGYRFSHIAGTIFENTNKPLRDWFRVIRLMLTGESDMSALQIHRLMGFGSYKTAWYMCHRIRAALADWSLEKFGGIVEIDETVIGGKAKNRHLRRGGHGTGGTGSARDVAQELLKRADAIVQHAQRCAAAEALRIEASRAIEDELTRMHELAEDAGLQLPSRKEHLLELGSEYAVEWRDAIAKELQRRLLRRNR